MFLLYTLTAAAYNMDSFHLLAVL